MATEIYFLRRLSVITIILIYCLASSFCKQQVPELCTSGDCWNRDNDDGRILSRKKRSLTFPEGSSLQLAINLLNKLMAFTITFFYDILVYDQTIPIVAAQLLFTVGVTCALAFELPSEPLYHITNKLRDNLLGGQDEKSEEETTTPAPPAEDTEDEHHSRIDYDNKRLNYINYNKNNYDSMNKHSYYYQANYNNNKYYQKPLSPNYYFSDKSDNYANNYNNKSNKLPYQKYQSSIFVTPTPLNQTKSVWTKVIKSFVNKFGQKVLTKKRKLFNGKKILGNIFLRKHNRVFPVFGKRSVDDHLTNEDKFYMEHHRNSRFSLFEKIEGFLKGRGKDGKACVLRALCETGQKNQDGEKGPFLLEILRAVFSLPHQVEPYKNNNHQHFDDAHSELEADCSQLYPQCEDSIWAEDFRF